MQTAISDYNHLVHTRVLRQIQKFMCYCTVLPRFILNLRAISKYKLPRAYTRRVDLTEGFLRYEFRGLIHGGAEFSKFYGILFVQPVENITNIYREGYKKSEQFVKNKIRLLRG